MKHPNETFNLFKSLGFDKVILQKNKKKQIKIKIT